jgi:hypothetical protein
MAKKQKSFAEKASSKGEGKDLVHVKYVKSVKSDKEGFWRFNESMIAMEKGQNLDVALKELEDAENLVDIVMPGSDEALAEEKAKVAEEAPAEEEAKEEAPAEEPKEEAPAEEEAKEEAPAEEPKEEAPVEEEAKEEAPAEEEAKEEAKEEASGEESSEEKSE